MTEPRAVVFDIGNVLITWHPERLYDTMMSKAARRKMFETVDLHCMNDVIDKGGPHQETVYRTAAQYPVYESFIRLWFDRWLEMTGPVIDPSVSALRALRCKGIPVLALSNFGIENFALAEQHYPFLTEFDQRFISGHMGVTKPSEDIYLLVERDSGFAPEDLLFADDRQENLDPAKRRGWHTHLFQDGFGWVRALREHGLLTEEEEREITR